MLAHMKIYAALVNYTQSGIFGFEMPPMSECPLRDRSLQLNPYGFHDGWPEVPLPPGHVPSIYFGERIPEPLLDAFPRPLKVTPLKGKKYPKRLNDFVDAPFLCVSEKAQSTIETLDPGIHQFVSVSFADRDTGKPLFEDAPRYFWNILSFVRLPDLFSLDTANEAIRTELQQYANGKSRKYVDVATHRAHRTGLPICLEAFHISNIARTGHSLDTTLEPEHAYRGSSASEFYITGDVRSAFNREKLTGLSYQLLPSI
ncbi:MAG TPA: hypothetical protein VJ890_23115 [Vineibacter sp.]|nr:hypothetical protein [Vineibacter sp.]